MFVVASYSRGGGGGGLPPITTNFFTLKKLNPQTHAIDTDRVDFVASYTQHNMAQSYRIDTLSLPGPILSVQTITVGYMLTYCNCNNVIMYIV